MIFSSPSWTPQIPCEIPDSIPVGQFALEGNASLPPQIGIRPPFIDGITGNAIKTKTLQERVDYLSRALSQELGWSPNEGSPFDKVVALYSLNTLDYFVVCWAVHRLNGICLALHTSSGVPELVSHMTKTKCQAIFTCRTLVGTSLEVANEASIPRKNIFTMSLPEGYMHDAEAIDSFRAVDQMIAEGSKLEPIPTLVWEKGQAKTQIAFFSPTSGTSGKQKLAMITHYNLIANVLQIGMFESYVKSGRNEAVVGAISFSHLYGLALIHAALQWGDSLIVFPRFDMQLMLKSIPQYRIRRLYLVPPILAALAANPFLLDLYDLSSVRTIITGAAALDPNLIAKLHALQPKWGFHHGYGLTETAAVTTWTSAHDIWHGSSGVPVPQCQLRLVKLNGEDAEGFDEPGEVLFKAPSIFAGYLGDDEATKKAFDEKGWLRSGDIGVFRKSPNGGPHLFILDRIKDMLKVKGEQVIPSDIETVLFAHPAVADVAVIGVPDELAGERPKAYIVRSNSAMTEMEEEELADLLDEYVQDKLHESHWLHDRIAFLPKLPKSETGKVLKKDLRAMATTS